MLDHLSPTTTTKRCAIYARVSSDPLKQGSSTTRQIDNCHRFCDSREWIVTATYQDLDHSAFKSKDTRPELQRLLNDLTTGTFDTIVVWRLDRLARRNDEFEHIWARCEQSNIAIASVTEPVDTTSGVGVAVMRMLITFAGLESTIKSERLQAKNLEDARKGLPRPGGVKCLGYDADMNIVEHEAKVIREAAQRVLNGESTVHIGKDFKERNIRGRHGAPMSDASLRGILNNHTIAGQRSYHGTYIAQGTWEPIIDPDTAATVRYLLAGSKGGRRRKPAPALLSGILRCSNCGNSHLHNRSLTRYVCTSECSKTNSIHSTKTEKWLTELVLWRLELRWPTNGRTPTLATDTSTAMAETHDWAAQALTRLNIGRYVDGTMSHYEYVQARTALETRVGQKLHHVSTYVPPAALPADFDPRHARTSFASLNARQKQAVLELELNHVLVTPGSKSQWDPGRLTPIYWQALPKAKAHLQIPNFAIAPRTTPYSDNPILTDHKILHHRYTVLGHTAQQLAHDIGCERGTVFRYLHHHRIPLHTADTDSFGRKPIPEAELANLYTNQQLPISELAEHFNTSKLRISRNLENYKIPVRTRNVSMVILDQLYRDPLVLEALEAHNVPLQPEKGSLAERFGTPQPINQALTTHLYKKVGLSTRQVELVTGIPQRTLLRHLRKRPDTAPRRNGSLGSPASQRYRNQIESARSATTGHNEVNP